MCTHVILSYYVSYRLGPKTPWLRVASLRSPFTLTYLIMETVRNKPGLTQTVVSDISGALFLSRGGSCRGCHSKVRVFSSVANLALRGRGFPSSLPWYARVINRSELGTYVRKTFMASNPERDIWRNEAQAKPFEYSSIASVSVP